MEFRHEYKFLISDIQVEIIKSRMQQVMELDHNAKENGCYEIRSIYFDDWKNTCFSQNEAGTDPRAKYRIRAYDAKDSNIVLEKKIKQKGLTKKLNCKLTREQYELVCKPYPVPFLEFVKDNTNIDPLLKELIVLRNTSQFSPKTIVIYQRIPFVEKLGNVRVTLDLNIASAKDYEDFFCDNIRKRPVLEKGMHLLEVKFDEFIPSYIKESLELGDLRQTTFSKYYYCRRYHL